MSETEVTVVGEAVVDVLDSGDGTTRRPGGSPLNVAVGLSRLGVATRLVSQLGDDRDGALIRAHLRGSGVDEGGLLPAPRTSTAVARILEDGSAAYDFDIDWSLDERAGVAGRLVHCGSIAATLAPGADRVEELVRGRAAGVLASFDPNIRPQLIGDPSTARARVVGLMAAADIVKLSDEDMRWIFPGATEEEAMDRVLRGGTRLVALTLGPRGAVTRTAGARVELPTFASTVVDTVGAGDAFMAGLLAAVLGRGVPGPGDEAALAFAAELASRCSAITVGRPGADPPRAEELDEPRH